MIADVVIGESVSLIGPVKGYLNGIQGFDDVIAETKDVFTLLEPALHDAMNCEHINTQDPIMTVFNRIKEAIQS